MIEVSNINEFNSLSSSQKHLFFDERVNDVVEALDGNALYKLLKPIILNTSENNYIRRRAIEVFTECVLIDKLKVWSELNILLQDWDKVEDSFLEIRRLKDLSFFYDVASDDIEKVYQDQTENSDAEIAAEALYHLGLIAMQKAFLSDSPDKCISNLNESHILFKESSGLIENRIDSDFFKIVTSLVLDFIDEKYGGIDQKIKTLSTLLLQKDIFTFDDSKRSYFHISFLSNITKFK